MSYGVSSVNDSRDTGDLCGVTDPITGAVCTLSSSNHMTHVDQSDPGLIVKWFKTAAVGGDSPVF